MKSTPPAAERRQQPEPLHHGSLPPRATDPDARRSSSLHPRSLPPALAVVDRVLDVVSRGIAAGCTVAISVLLLGMVLAASLQVLSRYVFPTVVGGPEEAARLAMVSIVFLGLPVLARHSEHIRLDIAQESISRPAIREWLTRGILLAELVFLVVLTVLAWSFVEQLSYSTQRSPALGIRLVWSRLPVLIGSALAVVVTVAVLVRRLLGTAGPTQERTDVAA